jgi:hypothetical protein
MLAKIVLVVLLPLLRLNKLSSPLLHQLLPHVLRSPHADRKVAHGIIHAVYEFLRKLVQSAVMVEFLRPPIALLRWDVRSGRDGDVWVYEEEGQELAVAWLCRVGEAEGEHAVLEDVWKDEEAVFAGQDFAQDLTCSYLMSFECQCLGDIG